MLDPEIFTKVIDHLHVKLALPKDTVQKVLLGFFSYCEKEAEMVGEKVRQKLGPAEAAEAVLDDLEQDKVYRSLKTALDKHPEHPFLPVFRTVENLVAMVVHLMLTTVKPPEGTPLHTIALSHGILLSMAHRLLEHLVNAVDAQDKAHARLAQEFVDRNFSAKRLGLDIEVSVGRIEKDQFVPGFPVKPADA